ncbi:hypothetical protein V8E53_005785 [Lactarius tabidus]
MSAMQLRHRLLEWVRWRRELGTVDGVVLTVGTRTDLCALPPNVLSRQEHGFIADITLDPDDPDTDPYLWERARAATFRCVLLVPITTAPYRTSPLLRVRSGVPSPSYTVCLYAARQRTSLFLPSPSDSEHPPPLPALSQRSRNWDPDTLGNVISLTSSSNSPGCPRGSACRSPRKGRYSTWRTSPPGICKSAMRQSKNDSVNARVDPHRKGKGRMRDICGSKELMNMGPREKKKTKLVKEVRENEEDEGEERTNFPASLDIQLGHAESDVTHGGDLSEEHNERDDSDDEVEIVVDAHRNPNPGLQPPAFRAQQHQASIPPPPLPAYISVHTSTPTPSSDVSSLVGMSPAILPAPVRREVVLEQHGSQRFIGGLQRKVTAVQPVSTLCHVAQRNFICHAIPADGSLDVQTDNSGLREWAKLLGFPKDEGGRDGRVVHSYENSRLLTISVGHRNVRHAVGGGSEMDKDGWATVGEMGRVLYGS